MQATSAMSTWIGTLARSGVVSGEEAAGLAVAAYVVGEERLDALRAWFAEQSADVAVREKRAAIEICIWMANADRNLDPEEAHFVKQVVMASQLDDDTVDALVSAVHDPPSLDDLEQRLTHPVLRELMLALSWGSRARTATSTAPRPRSTKGSRSAWGSRTPARRSCAAR